MKSLTRAVSAIRMAAKEVVPQGLNGTVILLAITLIFGCATTSERPITDPTERFACYGFSVLAPQGEHWFIRDTGTRSMIGFKKNNPAWKNTHSTHSFALLAMAMPVAEDIQIDTPKTFQKAIERHFQDDSSGPFRIVEHRLTPLQAKDTDLVKFYVLQEERDNPHFPGKVLNMRDYGYMYRHPLASDVIVQIWCSERYVKGEQSILDATLRQEVNQFLESIEFTQIK